MRAIYFFEFPEMTETDMHVEAWGNLMVEQAFAYKNLEPFALVSGAPNVGTECMPINFGTAEAPDERQVIRALFELPDIPGNEIIMLFSGTFTKEFGNTPFETWAPEVQQRFLQIGRVFQSIAVDVQGTLDDEIFMTDFLAVAGVEESRQRVLIAGITGIPDFEARQQFVPNVEQVAKALRNGSALPPDLDPAIVAEAQALIDAAPQEVLH